MCDVFIDCMKQYNDEEEHSVLERIFKMKLNGSRLIMITKQDIENPYFPIKFMNHENQSIFLQIMGKLNDFHDLSFQSEEFDVIEWKDEYYEPNYDDLSIDDISEEPIEEEIGVVEKTSKTLNESVESEDGIKHEETKSTLSESAEDDNDIKHEETKNEDKERIQNE